MTEGNPFDLLGLFVVLGFGIRTGWVFCDFLNEAVAVGLDRLHGRLLRRNARRVLAAQPGNPYLHDGDDTAHAA